MLKSVRTKSGHKLLLDDPYIENHIRTTGTFYEHWMLERIRALQLKGNYIDAGANFGNHAVYFDKLCPSAKVYAIEPVPYNYEVLCYNIVQNGCLKTKPLNVGLSAYPAYCRISKTEEQRWSQCELKADNDGEVIIVDLDRLRLQDISLIKIDCEGMELEILHGAIGTIDNTKPELFIEIWEEKELIEITKLLSVRGYEIKERYNEAPTYHFSTRPDIPKTFK